MKTKSIIDNKWVYSTSDTLVIGDTISFICNGRGRGGHYGVTATVTKVNRITFEATENACSYQEGSK